MKKTIQIKEPEKLFINKYTRLSPHDFDKFGGKFAEQIREMKLLDGDSDIIAIRGKGKITFKSF